MVEEDVSSGHGVGKSAQVSWAILWAISTHEDTRGVVTANTVTLDTPVKISRNAWNQAPANQGTFGGPGSGSSITGPSSTIGRT